MKTVAHAVVDLKGRWSGFFDTLYWNEREGYYYANSNYEQQGDKVCTESEFANFVMEKLST